MTVKRFTYYRRVQNFAKTPKKFDMQKSKTTFLKNLQSSIQSNTALIGQVNVIFNNKKKQL